MADREFAENHFQSMSCLLILIGMANFVSELLMGQAVVRETV